ncbi:MAG: hypothetical protein AB1941_10655 [Gemmatimonadota bacterium]
MKLAVRRAWTALAFATVLTTGCSDGPTDPTARIAGSYTASTVEVNGQARSLPAVLYDGPVTDGTNRYEARYEVTTVSLTLNQQDETYTFSGTYRLVSKDGRFTTETGTSTDRGIYSVEGNRVHFDSDRGLDGPLDFWGTMRNGAITLEAIDPLFEESNVYVFRR